MEDEEYKLDLNYNVNETGKTSGGDSSSFYDSSSFAKPSSNDLNGYSSEPQQLYDKNAAEQSNLSDIYNKKSDNAALANGSSNSNNVGNSNASTGSSGRPNSAGDATKNASDTAKNVGSAAKNPGSAAKDAGGAAKDAGGAAKNAGSAAKDAGGVAKDAAGGINPLDAAKNIAEEGGKNEDLDLNQRIQKEGIKQALNAALPGFGILLNSNRGNRALNEFMRSNRFERMTGIGALKGLKAGLSNPKDVPASTDSDGDAVNSEGKKLDETVGESSPENATISLSDKQKKNILIPTLTIAISFVFICCIILVGYQAASTILKIDLSSVIAIDSKEVQDSLISGQGSLSDDSFNDSYNNSNDTTKSTSSGTSSGTSSTGTGSNSNVVSNLIKIAFDQEGHGGAEYRNYLSLDSSQDWCAAFISWLFGQIDDSNKYIIPSGVAGGIPRLSVSAGLGIWLEDECYDSSTVPKVGDIVLFDPCYFDSADNCMGYYLQYPNNTDGGGSHDAYYSSHIGFVYKVDNENIYTIEGNTGGGDGIVAKKSYSRKYCNSSSFQGINGYYRPKY